MASIRSTIELVITGSTRGLSAAAAQARTMAERIAAAEDRVSDARTRSAAAEERVQVVEQRLNAARSQQEAALSRVGVAETNLARTREASLGATTRLSRAQADLDAVRSRSGATAEEVERAEARVTQVRQEADRSAAALQRSEAALASARANADRSSARVRQAEADIARARSEAVRASEALARRENDLNAIRRRGTDDMNRQRDGILGIFDAFGRLADAFSGADGASTSLLSKMSALNSVFSSIGGPIIQAAVGIAEFAAVLGAIGEIVGVVGGLIGQVLGGAPAILLALGAAAGTVALGMDGIKQAAQAAAPAFEKLKASVSGVFARELTPFFQRIGQVLPQLTGGFNSVAVSVSQVAKEIIATTTSARGLTVLNGILSGTATLFRTLAPGVAIFVKGLLDAANIGQSAFNALGTAIGSVFQKIGEVFSRLAADGTIGGAVRGLAATITGLGAVVAPLIELFIRMGAALGDSVGTALQGVGSAITQVTPFFVKLADVAGRVLVDAFNQLGPPLRELVDSILPGAGQGLDGFASVMHNVVLPAIAGFINFLRTTGIPAFIAFTQAIIINVTAAASAILGFVSGALSALSSLFLVLGVATNNPALIKVAGDIETAKLKVDGLKTSIDGLHDKTVVAAATTTGQPGVVDMKNQIALINSKKVDVTATTTGQPGVVDMRTQVALINSKKVDVDAKTSGAPQVQDLATGIAGVNSKPVSVTATTAGKPEVDGLTSSIAGVKDKATTTTANVPEGPVLGKAGHFALTGAINGVLGKTVTTTGNVPSGPTVGTQGNTTLTGAIGRVLGKIVAVIANVAGLDLVNNLFGAIGRLKDKVVNVVANVIGAGARFLGLADGGRAPSSGAFLVGERGPEILTLDGLGATVTPAARTRQVLSARRSPAAEGGIPAVRRTVSNTDQPIHITVNLSQEQIAGIAQVEIARRDRATKRVVLAGSGVTF